MLSTVHKIYKEYNKYNVHHISLLVPYHFFFSEIKNASVKILNK